MHSNRGLAKAEEMKSPILCCFFFIALLIAAGGEKKKPKKEDLSFDSWWVFYYACGQVGLTPPSGPHSSPQCPAFDFEL